MTCRSVSQCVENGLLLAVGLCFGVDGQDEGGCLIGTEGGRHDQVFPRLQREQLHHLAREPVLFRLGNGRAGVEEGGRELPPLCLVL